MAFGKPHASTHLAYPFKASVSLPVKRGGFQIGTEKLLGGMGRMFLSGSANSKSLTSTSFKQRRKRNRVRQSFS